MPHSTRPEVLSRGRLSAMVGMQVYCIQSYEKIAIKAIFYLVFCDMAKHNEHCCPQQKSNSRQSEHEAFVGIILKNKLSSSISFWVERERLQGKQTPASNQKVVFLPAKGYLSAAEKPPFGWPKACYYTSDKGCGQSKRPSFAIILYLLALQHTPRKPQTGHAENAKNGAASQQAAENALFSTIFC